MEINPDLKKDIIQKHTEMFEAYVGGDVDGFLFHLAENAILHGTAKGESFTSKQSAMAFYTETANQVVDFIKLEHCNTEVRAFDHYWILNEDLVFYAKTGDRWVEYGNSRITEVWSPIGDRVMITHIHCSLPDSNTLEGEQFNIQKLWDENIRLQHAVSERTAELERKNRELAIESALERVRSRTMAMQKSTELNEVAAVLFEQIRLLGGQLWGTGFALCNVKEGEDEFWFANEMGVMPPVAIPNTGDEVHRAMLQGWKEGKDYILSQQEGEPLAAHYRYLYSLPPMKAFFDPMLSSGIRFPAWQQWHAAYFSKGYLLIITTEPYAEPDIFKRFAKVFDQAYTRFLDLQKAEAQAREAHIESALERVRSRTLAMQKSDELAGTAAVLFSQLISLGIEPNRLFIILMKDNTTDMEAWVTDEDGSKVSMGFTGNYTQNVSLSKMYEGWKEKRTSLLLDMQGEELQQYFHYLHHQLKVPFRGGLEQKRRVQHIAYFSHGLIGMASPEPQPAETIHLLERFAAVFNLTYTRFNDLKIAEANALQAEQDLIEIKAAKQKAEEALTELKATQRQLIQSEKMASLGELTAGIAHEIQNPLNFVNNFSEVSKELIEEMKEELAMGNLQLVHEIVSDIEQNLGKIHHHGKRADGIVKGMLLHSRSGSGQKEPTDLNMLCDEYLRLAYHGLKAKDQSFNASFLFEADKSLPKVAVVPQDIGRVLLNLINNAFYAVDERKRQQPDGYEPMVTVSTEKTESTVQILVKDNGNGIPQKVLDKIFQPFFTTKPTGEGTGLGLSLSYDIVKAHGGELKVETEEARPPARAGWDGDDPVRQGGGTKFVVSLQMIN